MNGKVSPQLLSVVEKFSKYKVTYFGDVTANYQIDRGIDAVILSGSAARIVHSADRAGFEGVEQLIRTCELPLFGVCFGHQLLCWTFGAEVRSLPQQVADRFEEVRVLDSEGIFTGFEAGKIVSLAENHYDYVLKDSLANAGFTLLADSASCEVEAVKHKIKPFWGVQFHPERITVKDQTHPEGHKIIENFYRIGVKR